MRPPPPRPRRQVRARWLWLWGWGVAVLLASWILVWTGPARAGNPDLKWRTIETEHFYVHYSVGEEEAAERTAMVAERAYEYLSNLWAHRVFLKTHITLRDMQDTANGRATALPFPQITAYATAPEELSVLDAYDDWIDILITHELVHVVHLDTVHGIPRLINAVLGFGVLGKITQPNILQPRWIIEGVATLEESDFSSQGRRRSAQFDAFMRMAVLEGNFQTLDQASNGARIFPHGSTVYLYGVHFMYYIVARYGRDKLTELSHIYGGHIIPFGINRAMKKVLGIGFYELWNDFKIDITRRFKAQARRIRSRGLRQGRRLTYGGQTTRYPFWSPDDEQILFFKNDGHGDEGVRSIATTGGRIREGRGIGRQGVDVDIKAVIDVEDPGEAAFVGATGDLVFDMNTTYDYRYRWSDLFRWTQGSDPQSAEQLTFGLRASEPHVSPDGRWVTFRRNDIAQSRLGFLELATGDVTEVPPLGKVSQVYTPRWSPDGHKVAYSGWREGGYRDIYVYDREAGKTRRITADRHVDTAPSWSPDGRYIVFTSDRDDVANIYAFDTQEHSLHQVSNVLGGAFEPMVSHDGTKVAYVGYNMNGFDLWVMDFDPQTWLPVMPGQSDLPVVDDNRPPLKEVPARPPSMRSKRYQAIKTFFPRTIFPTALDFSTGDIGNLFGLEVGVVDVLGFHELALAFNYLMESKVATGRLVYNFRRLFPNFRFEAARGFRNQTRSFTRFDFDRQPGEEDSYQQTGYRERSTSLRGDMFLPVIRHPRHRVDAQLGYAWTRWKNLDAGDARVDPNAPATDLPEVGDAAQVNLRLSYSNLGDGQGRFTYGAERGQSVTAGVTVLDEKLGGDFGDVQVSGTFTQVFRMPWRGHQSLLLRVRGAASAGGLRRRGAFCMGNIFEGQDVLRSLLSRTPFTNGGCVLFRGFEPGSIQGRYFGIATGEYRIPLVDVDRGLGTLPGFLQRIGLIPFVDWGLAWTDPVSIGDFLFGAGAALVFSFRLGYVETIHLFFQYAHGFDDEVGVDSFRAVVSTSF